MPLHSSKAPLVSKQPKSGAIFPTVHKNITSWGERKPSLWSKSCILSLKMQDMESVLLSFNLKQLSLSFPLAFYQFLIVTNTSIPHLILLGHSHKHTRTSKSSQARCSSHTNRIDRWIIKTTGCIWIRKVPTLVWQKPFHVLQLALTVLVLNPRSKDV